MRKTALFIVLAALISSSVQAQTIPDTWWNNAVFYEIFVRSFNDSDGDGIGDFQGIIQKLDYLNDGNPATTDDLGIDGIWLMPINPSPSYHGYDVTDYFGINPDYGTLADFQQFLTECHNRGIKVIMDFVGNHSSVAHPYFTESATGPSATYRDWYNWSDTNPGGGWHEYNGDWYYALFWSGMPDWNVTNTDVVNYHYSIVDHWLALGVDGFRYDAVKHLVEQDGQNENTPGTFTYLENFYNHYKSVNPDAICVGEVWSGTNIIAQYGPPHTDFCFEFDIAGQVIGAANGASPDGLEGALVNVLNQHQAGAYAPFLTNHDQDRVYGQLGNDDGKMKLASAIYLTLPGVPFVYYGEEIGMTGSGSDPEKRTPMQWADGWQGGFTTGTPWASVQGDVSTANVNVQDANASSLLNHYREFIQLRQAQPALRTGELELLNPSSPAVMAYFRTLADQTVLVVHNLDTSVAPGTTIDPTGLCQSEFTLTDLRDGTNFGTVTLTSGSAFTLPETLQAQSTEVYLLTPTTTGACSSALTLSVDMAGEAVSGTGAYVQTLADGTLHTLSQSGSVWSTTLAVDAGTTVQYRFVNGNNAATGSETVPAACGTELTPGEYVREIAVGLSSATAPTVCFGQCGICDFGPVDLTFQVDLGELTPAPEGVHIAGTFQGWDPALNAMTNVSGSIWAFTATFDPGTYVEFKFINGDAWGEDESVPAECAVGWNRFATVGSLNETLDAVCFGECDLCAGAVIPGCMDSGACNYNPSATEDDGSCDYSCLGCTDEDACNYNETATVDDGSCDYSCIGCTYAEAENYSPAAVTDDGSCEFGPSFCGENTSWDPFSQTCVGSGTNPCPWDLTGDGIVGTSDLLELLGSFGAECD